MMEPCAGVVRKGRWRLAAPMYEVRSTMYDLKNSAGGAAGKRPAAARSFGQTAGLPRRGENCRRRKAVLYDVRFINNVRVAQIFSDH